MSQHTKRQNDAGDITVRETIAWLQSLPAEFQDGPMTSAFGFPSQAKRIVAYRWKEGGVGVAVNSMGSHLPVDDPVWEHVLQ